MSEKIHDVSADWAKRALVDEAKYKAWYAKSVADPAAFWAEHAKRIDWMKPFTKVKNTSFEASGDQSGYMSGSEPCVTRCRPEPSGWIV